MNNPIRMRNYGRILQDLIAHAVSLPQGEQRDALTLLIAKAMASRNILWNSDQETSPARILRDLEILSEGQLSLQSELLADTSVRPVAMKSNFKPKRHFRRR